MHQRSYKYHKYVKLVFLNSNLKENVYMSKPSGFIADGHKHGLYMTHKALYGLWQAPRAWNAKKDTSLTS